jgi:hypothetical protein
VEWVKEKYGISISYSKAKVIGTNRIRLNNISGYRAGSTPFFHAKSIDVRIPTWKLVTFNFKPSKILIDSLEINVNQFVNKYLQPQSLSTQNKLASASEKIIPETVEKLFNPKHIYRALSIIPMLSTTTVEINHFSASYTHMETVLNISTENITNVDGKLTAQFNIYENDNVKQIALEGYTQHSNKSLNISIKSMDGSKLQLPLASSIFNMECEANFINISLFNHFISPDSCYIYGICEVQGVNTFHKKIAENTVAIEYAGINFGTAISNSGLCFDSTTQIVINKLLLPLELSITNSRKPKVFIKVDTGRQSASDLFESLPKGLFSTLDGIKVQGNTSFELLLDLDFTQPDSLNLQVKFTPINFKILSFGTEDFRKINDTFSYPIFIGDTIVKLIRVNPMNPKFRALDQISPFVKNAVIISEDGGFYNHKGFDSDGFRYALAQNIKNNQLARGGSTITMQLVKNLYLNRNKNLLRKAEEALIVWLIETQRLVEKERILEIYFNIIDWGPGINGIAEASYFYFRKDPIDIELNEAIFLASIIPRPSNFMQNFDTLGNLKNMENYYSFVAEKMRERSMITDKEYDELEYNVVLKGIAKD